MALSKSSGIMGIKELKIASLETDVAGQAPTYNTFIDVPGIKSLTMEKNVKTVESRGDEMLLDTEDVLESITVSWENAELPMDACAVIEGSSVSTEGTAGSEVNELMETGSAKGGYFKIFALAKRGSNGVASVGVELFKVKGTLNYSFKGEDFAVCSFKGKAIPCKGTIDTKENPLRRLTFGAGEISIV